VSSSYAAASHRHVRRTLAELRDHFDDAVREGQSKGLSPDAAAQAARERLGSEEAIAASVLARPELRSFTARFPWAVFGIGPLLVWIGLAFLIVPGLVMSLELLQQLGLTPPPGSPDPEWVRGPSIGVLFFYVRILPLVLGFGMLILAARQRLAPMWPIAGVLFVSVFSGTTEFSIHFVDVPGQRGELDIGNSLIPLMQLGLTEAIGPFQPDKFAVGMAIAIVNVLLILGAHRLWQLQAAKVGPAALVR
jgi:hypothetical protein